MPVSGLSSAPVSTPSSRRDHQGTSSSSGSTTMSGPPSLRQPFGVEGGRGKTNGHHHFPEEIADLHTQLTNGFSRPSNGHAHDKHENGHDYVSRFDSAASYDENNTPLPGMGPFGKGSHKLSRQWIDARHFELESQLNDELDKLLATAPESDKDKWRWEFDFFRRLFGRYLREKSLIDWNKIQQLPKGAIIDHDSLPEPSSDLLRECLSKLVVVKLNGGLGTSMGCKGPKSVIPVRNDLTFLDLTMQQIEHLNNTFGVKVPLVLMNSFNTDEDTQKILQKYKSINVEVRTFQQSSFPRINKESLVPIATSISTDDKESWFPPGHGNFYEAFYQSGLLDKFVGEGRHIAFISNIDNLGATVDPKILCGMIQEKRDFVMEVTDKTRADVKGGTLIEHDDKLMLLEIAQVPKTHVDEFKSVSKFRIFNTNNLWCDLNQVKTLIDEERMTLEIIVNPKHLDNGLDVIQLETAAGAAIKNFSNAIGVNVPRSRFLPVKKTQDLLLVMSNLYELETGQLLLSSKRNFPTTPIIKLGSSFDKVQGFAERFSGVPDILELDHLTVSGDVWFGKNVVLKGTVIVIANHGDRIDIPSGSNLENKIVSGNLRILDH